ncbi:transposase [Thermodesulfobacteriota bacterium]
MRECNYHIVFCPKYGYSIFDGQIADYAEQLLCQSARQKDLVEVDGHQ